MRKLPSPTYNLKTILKLCADSLQNKELSNRILNSIDTLSSAEATYKLRGQTNDLYTIAATQSVGEWVTRREMETLYTQTFARKGGPTRDIYDAIRASSPGRICPLCNQRTVSTLDHHLAKAEHANFAITPINLVPACKDCNTDSGARKPTAKGEQTLHPYFDSVDDEIWLTAQLIPGTPPSLIFSANPPAHWTADIQAIVKNHFKVFGLGELYTIHAAGELVNIYFDIESKPWTPNTLKAHLEEQAKNRRKLVRNSWQAAVYEGLATSDWFCGGGYNEVAHSPLIMPAT
jgi:5-methylcytosine-specific restriction endonuclease McrA